MLNPDWFQVMKDEYDALIQNNTSSLTSLPPGATTIGCKRVFRTKFNADGSFQ